MSDINKEETFKVIQNLYGDKYLLSSTRGILKYDKNLKFGDCSINITNIVIPKVGNEFIDLSTYKKIINKI